jgi:putative addiction module component (TIGR02574 family)
MAMQVAQLLEEAVKLSPEERAALVHSLLESLETDVDENAEAEWRAEIERRVAEIDDGSVKLVPWEKTRPRLRSKVR